MHKARIVAVAVLMTLGAGACRMPEVPWGPPPGRVVCEKGDFAKCNPKRFRQPDCPRCNGPNAGY